MIVGGIETTTSDKDLFLLKTNAYGDTLWTRTFGTNIYDLAISGIQTPDGGFAVTGTLYGGKYAFLLKTDSLGYAPGLHLGMSRTLSKCSGISISPNPFHQGFQLTINKPYSRAALITIYDLTGHIVKRSIFSSETGKQHVDMSGLPSGIYVVKVQTTDGTWIRKILKQDN